MKLRSVVCVKAALDPVQSLRVFGSPPTVQATDSQPVFTIGQADHAAIQAALTLKKDINAQVSALSLGGSECEGILRGCLAAGCDEALHLACGCFSHSSPWEAANYVAAEISRRAYDLVLCGLTSLDDASGVFGQFLSELLGWPLISSVVELSINEKTGQLNALRLLERGDRQRVACPLPVVVSIHPLAFPPRYLSVLRIEETDASSIERILIDPEPRESGLRVIEINPARLRPRRMAAPGAGLSAAQRMQLMMGRGEGSKPAARDKIFEGSVDEAVERIIQYLREQGFL